MRIGVLGLFGSGNSGNDGSLEAMLLLLRRVRPDADLICFCQPSHGAAAAVSKAFSVTAMPLAVPSFDAGPLRLLDSVLLGLPRHLASLARAIRHARRLDLLILPGTGNLDDYRKKPLGIPLAIFGWCLAARLSRAKIAFVSVGAGPIHHPLSRWLIRSAAAMAHFRSYRDGVSKDFMRSIGLDTRRDPVYPDLVFSLPTTATADPGRADGTPLVVGVGIMAYEGWSLDSRAHGAAISATYLARMTEFVIWLLDRGHAVRILTGDATDQHAAADVVARIAAARPLLARDRVQAQPTDSIRELIRQIAQTDIIVASRFHNVVCALMLGRPTVSIGYGQKNESLMAEMGGGRYCQYIERLDVDQLVEQFTELVADRDRAAQRIREVHHAYVERLTRQEAMLESRFL